MRLLITIIGGLAAGLMLSACGTPPPARQPRTTSGFDRLGCGEANYNFPVWAQDGAQIAYAAYVKKSSSEYDSTVRAMSSDGSNDRQLRSSGFNYWYMSPDGSMILLSRYVPNDASHSNYDAVDVETGQTRPLGEWNTNPPPPWSPAGRWITFASGEREHEALVAVNARTGEKVTLTDPSAGGPGYGFDPGWSPGGRLAAFLAGPDGLRRMYIADITTGEVLPVPLTEKFHCEPGGEPGAAMEDLYARWSPDGSLLAVIYGCDRRDLSVRFVTPEGGEVHSWGRTLAAFTFEAWLGDGKHILFSGGDPSGAWQPAVANVDGTGMHTFGPNLTVMTWSPDGRRIMFHEKNQEGGYGYAIFDVDGTRLQTIEAGLAFPGWSPDSKHILFQTGDTPPVDLVVANGDGANAQVIQPDVEHPHWSPDGGRITFTGPDEHGIDQVYVINADGSGLTKLTHNRSTCTP